MASSLVVVSAQTTRSCALRSSSGVVVLYGLPDDLLQQRMKLCSLDGLLQHRSMRELRDDGIGSVAGHEREWDFPIGENIRNRVGFFASQIHVEDAGLQIIALRRQDGVAEAAVGAVDLVSE